MVGMQSRSVKANMEPITTGAIIWLAVALAGPGVWNQWKAYRNRGPKQRQRTDNGDQPGGTSVSKNLEA